MKLSIIVEDGIVVVDGLFEKIDMSLLGIPDDVRAVQWNDGTGHIEYKNHLNSQIFDFPDWISPIIDEHSRILEKRKENEKKIEVRRFYILNGEARKKRNFIRVVNKTDEKSIRQLFYKKLGW